MFYRIIVIDAGHGGKDSGATGNGYIEKNMTLKIVQNIKTNFDSDPLYKVYYTRLSDWYPTLTERYDLANTVSADRFLSVHINLQTLPVQKELKHYIRITKHMPMSFIPLR